MSVRSRNVKCFIRRSNFLSGGEMSCQEKKGRVRSRNLSRKGVSVRRGNVWTFTDKMTSVIKAAG